jgi:coenzyme F420-reducing hydrogenase delta subunit/ferredoxin
MPVLSGKELRIIGFLCNWCSYGGADTAGVGRFTQPTDLRIIRVPCSGRIDPIFIAKALLNGADGVLVSGCHPKDCHYAQGNFYARRRLEVLRQFLPALGIDPDRFEYTWVSASEGQRWQKVVSAFTERIHALGRAPGYEEIEIQADMAAANGNRTFAGLPSFPENGEYELRLAELKESIKANLSGLDFVIGWQQGFDPLHNTPLFMRSPEDVNKFVWGPLNVHNLATYLPALRNKKVGVVVKGCDSRSVTELLQEKLIDRDKLVVFSMPCTGVADLSKIGRILEGKGTGAARVETAVFSGGNLAVVAEGKQYFLPMADMAADKCLSCRYPNALVADHLIGERLVPAAPAEGPDDLRVAAGCTGVMNTMAFWRYHMDRCIRCHACRNACPICVCRDHCIAQSHDPHWISQEDTVTEKLMFQVVQTLHLAGRCTECGECQRACPMGIPVLELKRHMNKVIHKLFEYRAGTDPEAIPPLLSFQVEEKNINERGW